MQETQILLRNSLQDASVTYVTDMAHSLHDLSRMIKDTKSLLSLLSGEKKRGLSQAECFWKQNPNRGAKGRKSHQARRWGRLLLRCHYWQSRLTFTDEWSEICPGSNLAIHVFTRFFESKIVCDFWRTTYSSQDRHVVCLFAFMLDTRKKPTLKPSLWAQEFAHTV